MPNWYPSWTKCSAPAHYHPSPLKTPAFWVGLSAMLSVGLSAAIMVAWAPGAALVFAGLAIGGIQICTWWLEVRLICLGGDRSAIGAIYSLDPPPAGSSAGFAFDLPDYDTDYSFDLLLWPFAPADVLPEAFVSNQWDPSAVDVDLWPGVASQLGAPPSPQVKQQVELIIPQQSMASLGLGLTGEGTGDGKQHYLIHSEIEGPGMYDLRVLLTVMLGIFIAASVLAAIPVIGPILSWILSILAWLAFLFGGNAIMHTQASPPATGGWGGVFNPVQGAGSDNTPVDLAYVYGRWVYDSFHSGGNELHPVHYMIKIGKGATAGDLKNGDWPEGLGDLQQKYDAAFGATEAPGAREIQAQPQNQWTLHPLLDGCAGETPYPEPSPPAPNPHNV